MRPYPIDCELPETPYECTRGNIVPSALIMGINILTVFFSIFYVVVAMFKVYKSVNCIERRSERYSIVRYTQSNAKKKMNREMSQRVMIQGVLYTLALILIFLFPIIGVIMVVVTGQSNAVVDVLVVIFYPLQGKV